MPGLRIEPGRQPIELLPKNWPGIAGYDLCYQIYQRTYVSTEQYLLATLRREDDAIAPVTPDFYRGFGGLSQTPPAIAAEALSFLPGVDC